MIVPAIADFSWDVEQDARAERLFIKVDQIGLTVMDRRAGAEAEENARRTFDLPPGIDVSAFKVWSST